MTRDVHGSEATPSDVGSADATEAEGQPFEVVLPPPPCADGSCALAASRDQPQLTYRPLHPELFAPSFRYEWLAESFAAALEDGSEGAIRSILREEVPGRVFSFDMLRLEFCEMLLEEILHYESSGLPVTRPNSMNNYGVILNQIGMRPLLDSFQQLCILPLSRLLYPKEGGDFVTPLLHGTIQAGRGSRAGHAPR